MDFKDIIGHENIIKSLKKSIKDGTTSHAYLFQGEKGIGKKKLSYAFSKALLCLADEEKPCNNCVSCKRFDSSTNPDFLHIEPEKNMIRKAEIEKLQRKMPTTPINSSKKVILIEEAHLMNKESTNKLLKTLEEPPPYVHIILTSSEPFKLLQTILSRVQLINFFPVPKEKIQNLLIKEYGKSKEDAKFITEFTKGAIGKSIELSKNDELFGKREEVLKILNPIILGDKTKIFYSMDFFNKYEEDIGEILDIIIYYFRDLLLYKKIGNSPLIINKDKIHLLSQHSFMDFNKISDIIINIMETKDIIKRNINYKLAIEAMLLNI
ncbi:MAG: DNA polymerase III subunit delta' [Tissierella sp.]|uniref:DNA polymerase III subunit delta' n=1 Tax=Tissierella sp. TaxID=41274 RepID=UPI003F98ADA7